MNENLSDDNLYKLDGKVPISKVIPFSILHLLAMFISNITPILMICAVAIYNGNSLSSIDIARIVQSSMIVAGIGTLIQLYPIWKVGAKLPMVMGISFTFVSVLIALAVKDYGIMIGAVIVGGIFQGILGLTAKYWIKYITPIVSACVVIAIGFSLLPVGISSFGKSIAYPFGSLENLLVGAITLVSCLLFQSFAKGSWKQLYILFGLIVGYIVSLMFNMVDFGSIGETVNQLGIISLPSMLNYAPKFDLNAIISVALVYLVSATETIGNISIICTNGLNRDATNEEISGAITGCGFISAISGGIFGCTPITSYAQNAGLITITKVINKFTIMITALILILAGFLPPVGAFLSTLPECVLGGCSVIMFGSIIVSGIQMLATCDLSKTRNMIIASTALSVGIGISQVEGILGYMPETIQSIFGNNPSAGVFVIALLLSLILPKEQN